MITLRASHLTDIFAHAREAEQTECCGLIGGTTEEKALTVYKMQNVARDLKKIRAVTAEVYVPAYPGAHPVPYLRVKWDKSLPISYQECAKQLRDGEPRIEVNASAEEITLASYMMNPGEERIVGWRLAEVLGAL